MTDDRAILATYSDFRLVKSRKVLQIVMEVPIEQATDALNKLGFPDPSGSVWCGIVVLDKQTSRPPLPDATTAAPQSGEETAAPSKPRRPFHEMPLSAQAGMRRKEPLFWQYLRDNRGFDVDGEDDARDFIRDLCGVTSCSEILPNTRAAGYWLSLERSYQQWLTTQAHGDLVR